MEKNVHDQLMILEEIYAYFLDEGQEKIDKSSTQKIYQCVDNILFYVSDLKNNFK